MAGLGIGPEEFALFELQGAEERNRALDERLAPKLRALGEGLRAGLARVAGTELHAHVGRVQRRKGTPAGEMFVAFCGSDRGYKGLPHLLLAVSAGLLHARVAVRGAADRGGAMRRTLEREAANLARRGKPFRRLRSYAGWRHAELPELAPAHSAAFWSEQAEAIGAAGLDLGVAWPAAEARSLSVGDLLGAFRDLAPLFKLLCNAA
jgi:hypothetical protein